MTTTTRTGNMTLTRTLGNGSSSSIVIPEKEVRSGSGVSGYKEKIRHHVDASSPYVRYSNKVNIDSHLSAICTVVKKIPPANPPPQVIAGRCNGFLWTTVNNFDSVSLSAFMPGSADSKALAKFNQALIRAQQSVQGISVLGELHKTIEQFRHPLQGLRNGLSSYLNLVKERGRKIATGRSLRSGLSQTAKSGVRSPGTDSKHRAIGSMIQSTWLEYTFGLRPTLMDIQDTAHAVAHLVDKDLPVPFRVHGQYKWKDEIQSAYSAHLGGASILDAFGYNSGTVTGEKVVTSSGFVRYSGAVVSTMPGYDTARDFGFSLPSVLPSLWELVPYSWAVDYFSNVGDILNATSVLQNNIAWVNRAVYVEVKERHYTTGITPNVGSTLDLVNSFHNPGSFTVLSRNYSRAPYTGSLIPSFYLELPSAKQAINLFSVLTQSKAVSRYLGSLLSNHK